MNASLSLSSASLTRRNALGKVAAAIATLATASAVHAQSSQQPAEEKPCTSPNQARTSIHYVLDFNASPERFYQAILDSKRFANFSGLPATIDATEGGAITMFGGLIQGRNIELVPSQRIVQAWRPASWGPGVYSIVHFELKTSRTGTNLTFDHTGFASGLYDHLDWGWKNRYWAPLKKYFS